MPTVEIRSTKRLSAKGMKPIFALLTQSEVLARVDRRRCRPNGILEYTSAQMLALLFYIECKELTLEQFLEQAHGPGGQRILASLGMPFGKNHRRKCPSIGWISEFRNHVYPKFRKELDDELTEAIIESMRGKDVIVTCDSTPVEASRYSGWAGFNTHYNIYMAKAHLIMVNGVIVSYTFTEANEHDGPILRELLDLLPNARTPGIRPLTDGSYAGFLTYTDVFLKTGTVMSSNIAKNAVFQKCATWDKALKRYAKLHKEEGFVETAEARPEFILRFLASHDQAKFVGRFLRNLDMMRGEKAKAKDAKDRHVCETVHRAMKRWVDFTVRDVHTKYVTDRLSLRVLVCRLLSLLFKPYVG